METLFGFLLNASAGIALFYLVYWLFLRKETFHTANRIYLLLALFSSLLLPLFPIHYTVLLEQKNDSTIIQTVADTFQNIPVIAGAQTDETGFNWLQALLVIYFTGAAIFFARILFQSFSLLILILKNGAKQFNGTRIIENEKYGLPFSYFNLVFINPKFHKQIDLPEILAHEKVHIRENHWFDLLLIELLTVIFWFNPFIWFFERSIKQNHEYLADKGVLLQGHNLARYQAILLNQLMGMQIIGITNNLNFALNTNRLKMMTKKKTSVSRRIRFVWTLPVLALLLFAFSKPSYRVKDPVVENNISFKESHNAETKNKHIIKGKILHSESGKPIPGATILVAESAIGTVSDFDGSFTLINPNPIIVNESENMKTRIVVSYVGLKTVAADLGLSNYGTKDVAYSISNIDARDVQSIGNEGYIFRMSDAVVLIDTDIPPPPPHVKEDTKTPPPSPKGDKEVFYIVEDMPKYPSGQAALALYVRQMQRKLASAQKLKGKAKVSFTVNTQGKVSDIKVVEKDNDGAAKGAYLIASQMKDWMPGKQRGKAVPVKYLMPVEF